MYTLLCLLGMQTAYWPPFQEGWKIIHLQINGCVLHARGCVILRKERKKGGGKGGKEGRKKQTTSSRASATEAPIGLFTVS